MSKARYEQSSNINHAVELYLASHLSLLHPLQMKFHTTILFLLALTPAMSSLRGSSRSLRRYKKDKESVGKQTMQQLFRNCDEEDCDQEQYRWGWDRADGGWGPGDGSGPCAADDTVCQQNQNQWGLGPGPCADGDDPECLQNQHRWCQDPDSEDCQRFQYCYQNPNAEDCPGFQNMWGNGGPCDQDPNADACQRFQWGAQCGNGKGYGGKGGNN